MIRLLAAAVALPFVTGVAPAAGSPRHVVLTFGDPRIVEASGLVLRHGLFTTVNDSGDTGRVFTVDATGRTVGVTSWRADAVDDEAVAPLGRHAVLVGDIGDNLGSRASVVLRRVQVGRGDRTVTPTSYELTYPGGPVDAETLMVQPGTGQVLVVTKGFFGGTVLAAPRHLSTDRPNRLRPVGAAPAVATDGAFFPDGRHLVIRTYGEADFYTYPGLRQVGRLRLPYQHQGEGIAVDERGRVFTSSEGVRSQVLRVDLPGALLRIVAPPRGTATSPSPPPSPSPSPPSPPAADVAPPAAPDLVAEPGGSPWPFVVGGLVGLAAVVVLVRSLRPR